MLETYGNKQHIQESNLPPLQQYNFFSKQNRFYLPPSVPPRTPILFPPSYLRTFRPMRSLSHAAECSGWPIGVVESFASAFLSHDESLPFSLSPSLCNKPMVGDGIAKETISEMKFAHFCGFLPFPDFCRFRGTKRNERGELERGCFDEFRVRRKGPRIRGSGGGRVLIDKERA